jgi:hypothetical protein
MVLDVSFFIEFDKILRLMKRTKKLCRTEVLLLCKIYHLQYSQEEVLRYKLKRDWRINNDRLNHYLARLELLGYVWSKKTAYSNSFKRSKSLYYLTDEGKHVIRFIKENSHSKGQPVN